SSYYTSRPRFDRLGNPMPDHSTKFALPGDLGPSDPRWTDSPASLPGDLGPNDPRRSGSPHVTITSEETPKEGAIEGAASEGDGDGDTEGEEGTRGRGRGRKRPEPGVTTSGKAVNVQNEDDDESPKVKPDPTKGESKFTGLRVPKIKTPAAEGKRVHPSTAFDAAPSGASTPFGSDDERRSELREAQKLTLTMSAIHNTPAAHRVIRQIIRGDYVRLQQEAAAGKRRQRMYLVATDLSPESEYALEWTIGTVLRDGDTLFAVYASDLESLAGGADEGGVEIGHGAEMVKDTAQIVNALPNANVPQSPGPSNLAPRSLSRGQFSPAVSERYRAIEDISQRCIHLLRKTRLQVRIVVEVFHCKSPRHMMTELIDYLSPTLVIIGSRGRSAVKGVLLGSFSNYLVTKSSVPVMVARKKLRKHSKSKRNKDGTLNPYAGTGRSGMFTNVIQAPKRMGLRVQGWDQVGID
ncbi:adenine nucleotide alpha hydrolases-like protein, partial [Piedraia hortae CBS 480.64]